jgi:hypothetical protein
MIKKIAKSRNDRVWSCRLQSNTATAVIEPLEHWQKKASTGLNPVVRQKVIQKRNEGV